MKPRSMYAIVFLSCVVIGHSQLLLPSLYATTQTSPILDEKPSKVTLTVNENPGLCDHEVNSYSGYFGTSANATDERKLFYWFFESRDAPTTDPLVMWLTGGPGCSSMLAALAENGPCQFDKSGKLVKNSASWNNNANVVWVDQPAGTGFSVGSNSGHMYESIVAEQMYGFVQAFIQHFEQFQSNEFFITGESYGGHYVPCVSHRVWEGNQNREGLHINLKGLAVGNGMTDPIEQFKWFPEMANNGGKSEGGTAPGVITDETTLNQMKANVQPCIDKIAECTGEDTYEACAEAQAFCTNTLIAPYAGSGMNTYDQRVKCEVPPLCYNFSAETNWLNSEEVQKKLGVDKKWESCNFDVNRQFGGDWMIRYDNKLVDMLNDGVRVLIYAGDCDFICNWLGNKHWTLKLDWPHKTAFNDAVDNRYMVNDEEAGRIRMAHNFAFMQVYQAGHMVPLDQPHVTSQMINEFLRNKLNTSALPPLPPSPSPFSLAPGIIAIIVVASIAFVGVVAFLVRRICCRQARGPNLSLGTSLADDYPEARTRQ